MFLPLALQLPDAAYLVVGCIIVALIAIFGSSRILAELRAFRTNLANELKQEIATQKEGQSISVHPNPLRVQVADEFMTVSRCHEMHQRLEAAQRDHATNIDTQLGRERGARKEIHEQISDLTSKITALQTETKSQSACIADLKQQGMETAGRIDAVPMRTIQLLRETQQLHHATK